MRSHEPVLYDEVMAALLPHPGGRYIDGTVGGAGHARGILERSDPSGSLLGIDLDTQALQLARETLAVYGKRVTLVQGSFAHIAGIAREYGFGPADGVLLDLGLSTMQLSEPGRGFSFQAEGPLDMRFDASAETTAEELVNTLPEEELADVLYQYGEERMSRRIARAIVNARPLHTTTELASEVSRVVRRRGRVHPATRTFQALRIAVNNEVQALAQGMAQAVDILSPGGRLAVISFHSLEDREVKNYFREQSRLKREERSGRKDGAPPSEARQTILSEAGRTAVATLRLVTRRPIRPSATERARNPRSRSAKLRVAEKLPSGSQLDMSEVRDGK